jgi:4-hydroxy-L-threonine phosphate dehydrogenase PdxA
VTYRDITIVPFLISVKKLPRIRGARHVPLRDVSSALPVSNLTRKVARAVLAAAAVP